jgi:hypothetical protein
MLDRRFTLMLPLLSFVAACQSGSGQPVAAGAVRGTAVAILGVEGPPAEILGKIEEAIAASAALRGLRLVETTADPRFQVKAYVSAAPDGSGTVFSYAWDVIGAEGGEPKRVESGQTVNRSADDPWSLADDATIKAIADGSVNALVQYLATAA